MVKGEKMNLFRQTLCFVFIFCCTSIYAQDWIPYQPQQYVPVQTNVVTSYVYQPQPLVVYQYVPYVVNQPVITEHHCLLYKSQKITYVPQIQYVYQPTVIYR